MRSMGQGYHGIKKMTALMDMPHPMTTNNYDKIVNNITTVVNVNLLEPCNWVLSQLSIQLANIRKN